jgi:hypothetical protein
MDDVGIQMASAQLKLPNGTRGVWGELSGRHLLGVAQNVGQRCRGEPGDLDLPTLRSPLQILPVELPGWSVSNSSRRCFGSWLLINTNDSPTARASNHSKTRGCFSGLRIARTSKCGSFITLLIFTCLIVCINGRGVRDDRHRSHQTGGQHDSGRPQLRHHRRGGTRGPGKRLCCRCWPLRSSGSTS